VIKKRVLRSHAENIRAVDARRVRRRRRADFRRVTGRRILRGDKITNAEKNGCGANNGKRPVNDGFHSDSLRNFIALASRTCFWCHTKADRVTLAKNITNKCLIFASIGNK
jgi:hypothetical protein